MTGAAAAPHSAAAHETSDRDDVGTAAVRSTQPGSALKAVSGYFDAAADALNLGPTERQWLAGSARELQVQFSIQTTEGSQVLTGYRVQHNGARGPFKGGLLFHPNANHQAIRALAQLMTWKSALAQVPFGGAKGGVACDPSRLTRAEQEQLTRQLTSKLVNSIGPTCDIPAPDIGTGSQTMAWIMDEYSKYHGHSPAVVTGKPVDLGGSPGRLSATGQGLVFMLDQAMAERNRRLADCRVAVQGFGKVGGWMARILHGLGCRVIAVADASGAVLRESGIDIAALTTHVQEGGQVVDYPHAERLTAEEFESTRCDVFVPAALTGLISEEAAERLDCGIVIEGANSPMTPAAERVLVDRGVHVVPDIMASAGGLIVSYFEWVQNLQHLRWDEAEIRGRLKTYMTRIYNDVAAYAAKSGEPILRRSAFQLAIKRVVSVVRERGHID